MAEHEHTSWSALRASRLADPAAQAAYQQAGLRIAFGEQVRRVREAAGISQAQLAKRMGTSQPTIARLELGGVDPKLETLERVSRALGVDLVIELRPKGGTAEEARRRLSGDPDVDTITGEQTVAQDHKIPSDRDTAQTLAEQRGSEGRSIMRDAGSLRVVREAAAQMSANLPMDVINDLHRSIVHLPPIDYAKIMLPDVTATEQFPQMAETATRLSREAFLPTSGLADALQQVLEVEFPQDWARQIDPAWKSMIVPELTSMEALRSLSGERLAWMTDLTTLAGGSLASLVGKEVGSLLTTDTAVQAEVAAGLSALETSYAALIRSFQQAPLSVLSYPPEVSERPTLEVFTTADLAEAVTVERTPDDRQRDKAEVRRQLFAQQEQGVSALLEEVAPELLHMWTGASQAILSGNPDRARHATASLRTLLENTMERLAPDDSVREWAAAHGWRGNREYFLQSEQGKDIKPTYRARLRYIVRHVNSEPTVNFFEADIESALSLFRLLSPGVHKAMSDYTDDQVTAFHLKAGSLIQSLVLMARMDG